DADAVIAQLTLYDQPIEDGKKFGVVISVSRRAVQLQKIQGVDGEILQAAFDKSSQVLRRVPSNNLSFQTSASLGCNNDLLFAFLLEPGQQTLTAAVAVDIGRI